MKKAGFSLFALVAIAAIPLLTPPMKAQEGGQASPPGSPAAVPVPTTSAPAQPGNADAANAASAADFKPVKVELVGRLDSKSAKTGDTVVVKTREKVRTADGREIPKGSKLMGHITKVQAHSSTSQNSELAVLFDQAQIKGGQTVAIRSTIESVASPEGSGQSADMSGTPMGPGAGAPSGGGAMAGSRGATGSTGAPAPPAVPQTPTTTATADPGSTQGSANGSSSSAGRVVAGSGPTAIRTTSIPNVYLASNAALKDSGVLFAAKENVHLDGGTEMVLDIAQVGSR